MPKHPQRIAVLGNQAFSMLNFRRPLLAEMARQGHEVHAIAPDFDEDTREALLEIGCTAISCPLARAGLNPFRDSMDVYRLARTLKSLRLDTLLSFSIKPVVYGTLAAKWVGIPNRYALIAGLGYAFGPDSTEGLGRRAVRSLATNLYRVALAQADRVFMQNPDDAQDFIDMGIVPSEKIVRVNGTGVVLDDWPVLPPVTEPVTFVLAARLLEEKGIYDYVEAARQIKHTRPDARFLLLGGLDANPNSLGEAEIGAWVDEGLIEWPGHVQVRPWLGQASVFVLPSYYREGIPRSIQEALASGRPIITTDAPGCRETVIHGENGWLVPPRNADALATAMRRFLDDPGLIVSMGARSRLLAEERFDVRAVNAVMLDTMGLAARAG